MLSSGVKGTLAGIGERDVATTSLFQTTVDRNLQYWNGNDQGITKRIAPGDYLHSAIWYRMSVRADVDQMPPIFSTEMTDASGLSSIMSWISTL